MVYAPEGELHTMGRTTDEKEVRRLADTEPATTVPRYARIELPLLARESSMRRFADDLHGLANQIAFSATRYDLHPVRRLAMIHSEIKGINKRWKHETGIGGKSTDKPDFTGIEPDHKIR